MNSLEVPIPEILGGVREALQVPPGALYAPVRLSGRPHMDFDPALREAVVERSLLAVPPNDEISAAVLISLEVMRAVPGAPTDGLLDTIRTADWRSLQGGHSRRAVSELALGYDRARRRELVADLSGRYPEFITRIGGECLVTLALAGVVRHGEFYGDPSVHCSPFQIARWRADFPPSEVSNSRFLQALQRLSAQTRLMPNLLGLLRDNPMLSATHARQPDIANYRPES